MAAPPALGLLDHHSRRSFFERCPRQARPFPGTQPLRTHHATNPHTPTPHYLASQAAASGEVSFAPSMTSCGWPAPFGVATTVFAAWLRTFNGQVLEATITLEMTRGER